MEYTIVMKQKAKKTIIFDVYENSGRKQRIIGNIICFKRQNSFAVKSIIEEANTSDRLLPTALVIEKLKSKALVICEQVFY